MRQTFSIFLFCALCVLLRPSPAAGQRIVDVPASLTYSPGAIIRHPVANALDLRITPEAGLSADGALRLVAQLRNSATDTTTPLASSEIEPTGAGPYSISFTAAQMNQTLTAGAAQRDVWLVVFKQETSDSGLEVWWTGSVRLTAHGASLTAANAPVPVTLLALNAAGKAPLANVPLLDATAHAANEIDSRIAGKTASDSTKLIFTTANHATGTYVRSATRWGQDIDITCLGVWNSQYAAQIGFTAISPNLVFYCNHAEISEGATLRWVTAGNEVVNRTMGASVLVGNDLRIGKLTAALPDSIVPARLPDRARWIGWDATPVVYSDQEKKLHIGQISSTSVVAAGSGARAAWYELPVSGDSGNSFLVVIEGGLVPVGLFTNTNGGLDDLTALLTEVSAAVTTLGGTAPQTRAMQRIDATAISDIGDLIPPALIGLQMSNTSRGATATLLGDDSALRLYYDGNGNAGQALHLVNSGVEPFLTVENGNDGRIWWVDETGAIAWDEAGGGDARAATLTNLLSGGATADIEITDATKGIILKSPNGNRWRVTVSNGGTLVVTGL